MSGLSVMESRDVPLSLLRARKGFNLRDEGDLVGKEIDELAISIRSQGLLTPLLVQAVDGSDTFNIISGNRRYAAIRSLGLRGTVPVRVLPTGTAADAVLKNITENTSRKSVHPADLAKRLYELEKGIYPGVSVDAEGKGALPVDRAIICEQTGLTTGYVGNLIRAWAKLCETIRTAWRELDIPTDVVVKWGKIKDEDEQIATFEAWKEEQAEAAARKAAGEKKARKASSEGDEDDEEDAGPQKRKMVSSMLEKFMERREREKLSARDLEVVDAKISTLRWVLGETKRLTFT